MKETVRYCWIAIMSMIILGSCARYGNPGGGIKDVLPPKIVEENSEENFQTNFSKREFSFEFNEWIKLQNPVQQVVVSPPTDFPIKVSERGKKLTVEFSEEEVLKENVTYQINFGEAVKDFTEGNTFENFIFVFSTGDKIDSLSMKGNVRDVLTSEGESDVLVVLYDDLSDTCFTTERPFYFSKTDKEGNFELKNLRSDTFQVFALKDGNVNYFYDLPSEKVGFLDSLLIIKDTTNTNIQIELFDEEDDPRMIDYSQEKKGLIKLNYDPLPNDYDITAELIDTLKYVSEIKNDSIYIWHNILNSDSSEFYVTYDQTVDTILNKKSKRSLLDSKLKLDNLRNASFKINKGDSIKIEFNKPLLALDTSLIQIKDSSAQIEISAVGNIERELFLLCDNLHLEQEYTIQLFPSAVSDWWGQSNEDTLSFNLTLNDPESYGTINLSFSETNGKSHSVSLKLNDKEVRQFVVSEDRLVALGQLMAGKYTLSIIEDINGDGVWTPGNVKEKRHSEKIKSLPLEDLKAGWDLELTVDLKDIFYDTSGK